jgi:hypothetical protein
MARITDDQYDIRQRITGYPAKKPYAPTVKPVVKKTTQYYQEQPYDNSGALAEEERRRLLAAAEARRQTQIKQALARDQRRGNVQVGGGANAGDIKSAWNQYTGLINKNWNLAKNALAPVGNSMSNAWQGISQGLVNMNLNITNPLRQAFGFPTVESWQRPGAQTGTTYFPGYSGGWGGQRANFPNYNVNVAPGWGEDWGMGNAGTIANRFGGGQLDRANWGKGVPSWDEVLKYADPNAFDPYDIAGNPYVTAQDIPGGGGGGGYGGYGGYSSSPGYYGNGGQYSGAKWYENLLQWNI